MNMIPARQDWTEQTGSDLIAHDCQNLNFWDTDRSIRDVLELYLSPEAFAHFAPHLERLGQMGGGILNELAMTADKHGPVLHHRDRFGRDQDWVEYHPAYRRMEDIAYGQFGMHAMSRREGVLGWSDIVPPLVKYAFNYLFAQSEFGLLCPVSATDTCALLIQNYAGEELKRRYLPGMLTQDMDGLLRGAQFMTEKAGGSDISRSEAIMEGAVAFLLGEPGRGLKQMMDQVNLCRLSHGFRAAGMMRRCLNEALQVANSRIVFGRKIVDHALARRQLLKLILPTEQALSVGSAAAMALANGDTETLRILTPLVKYRACRDNVKVATGAMEMRGGNGFIEDWSNAKLVRDAHLGVLWEGTSSVNAIDIVRRAVGRERSHLALANDLHARLDTNAIPGQFRGELNVLVDRAVEFVDKVAADPAAESSYRKAASALYHVTSAALMASEGARLGAAGKDARRLLMARLVIDHRLERDDPFRISNAEREAEIFACLQSEDVVSLERVSQLLAA